MPQAKSRQSITMHRRVQVADIRKRSKEVSVDSIEQADKKKNTISHFVAEPIPESEMIQDAIQAVIGQGNEKAKPIAVRRESKSVAAEGNTRALKVSQTSKASKSAKASRDVKVTKSEKTAQAVQPVSSMKLLLPVNSTRPARFSQNPTKAASRCVMRAKINKKNSQAQPQRLSAQEIKEQEIAKAIYATNRQLSRKKTKTRKYPPMEFGFKRVALALAMSAVAVLGIVYLVDTNSPDISLKVAAMQNGINAVYPEYTPRGYILSDITSENGKVTLNFKNPEANMSYSLIEESIEIGDTVTLADYVGSTFGENYTKLEEQGIIVYIGSGGAAWADNGVLYKLRVSSGSLTRKQILTIATTK